MCACARITILLRQQQALHGMHTQRCNIKFIVCTTRVRMSMLYHTRRRLSRLLPVAHHEQEDNWLLDNMPQCIDA